MSENPGGPWPPAPIGVTVGGEAGGQMPPWQLRCGPLFRNGPPWFGFLCFL